MVRIDNIENINFLANLRYANSYVRFVLCEQYIVIYKVFSFYGKGNLFIKPAMNGIPPRISILIDISLVKNKLSGKRIVDRFGNGFVRSCIKIRTQKAFRFKGQCPTTFVYAREEIERSTIGKAR